MNNQRAYSLLEIKSIDEEKRIVTGIATTPSSDRMGDVVEPKGAQFKLPIPLLWQHNSSQPIGHVTAAKVTDSGIEVTCQIAKMDEPGKLQERLDEAWQSIKSGLVKGFSIGFKSLEHQYIDDSYGIRFIKWLWLELSAVTIPANGDCTIQSVKAVATEQGAAPGPILRRPIRLIPAPGASGATAEPTAQTRAAIQLIPRNTP